MKNTKASKNPPALILQVGLGVGRAISSWMSISIGVSRGPFDRGGVSMVILNIKRHFGKLNWSPVDAGAIWHWHQVPECA